MMPEPHLDVAKRIIQLAAKLGGFLAMVTVLLGFLFNQLDV